MINNNGKILLEHGSGGELTNRIINDIFLSQYYPSGNTGRIRKNQTDSAILEFDGSIISFTTDSYVIKPLFFPGGDIGKLSVCGTVNDIAVSGAVPKYISASFVIEEGFPVSDLEKVARSQASAALEAGVEIVCGDTKVVEEGSCDGLFINTSGIGFLENRFRGISTADSLETGDVIIVSGCIGSHGTAVLAARENLPFSSDVVSDCAPLSPMIRELLENVPDIVFMRDATRGGIATVLCELSEMTGSDLKISEDKIPYDSQVRALTDILGLDPLYLANEGTIIIAAKKGTEEKVLSVLGNNRYGRRCAVIGEVTGREGGKVLLETVIGGKRRLYRLTGFQLPRIC